MQYLELVLGHALSARVDAFDGDFSPFVFVA
jgi:hypothetical protein